MSPEEQAALDSEARRVEGDVITAAEQAAGAGAPPPEAEQEGATGKLLGELYKPLFAGIAPAWKVSDMECAMLGQAHGALLDKYFPDGLGVELTALFATVAIFLPRWGTPRKVEPTKDETPSAPAG